MSEEEVDGEIKDYLTEQFDYDELKYSTLDYRGAAVATKEQVDQLAVQLIKSLNNLQLIYGGVSAIGIAIGFLMLNTGTISLKNTTTMLRVSLIENMICAIGIWCLGYRICVESIGGLIGTGLDFDIFRSVPDSQVMKFIVLFACAQFTSSITTGALAERTYVDTQIAFKVMLNVLIFPIIASWVWGGGWLAKYGYQDFGGSGFHIVGGTCGLVGANFLGPRLGLFNDSLPIQENKIREKLERKEHQIHNNRINYYSTLQQLRGYVQRYIQNEPNLRARQWIDDQNGVDTLEKTVREIYRKVFVNDNQLDFRYQRQKNLTQKRRTAMDQYELVQRKVKKQGKKSQSRHDVSPNRAGAASAVQNAQTDNGALMRTTSAHAIAGQDIPFRTAAAQNANNKKRQRDRDQKASNSSSNDDSNESYIDDEICFAIDDGATMTNYYKDLPAGERVLIKNILSLDANLKQNDAKIRNEQLKIEKLREKYLDTFRSRNPDLRHLTVEQIKDYTDLLIRESQNLRQPNSMILVAGGVLFIFFGTFSLSILITRVFYKDFQIDGQTYDVYLFQAHRLMEVGFDSMIDKLASVSGSVVSVLLLKPLIYGHWKTQEQTSCVYNVETISASIIAGIASVAGASGQIEIHSALVIGAIGGVIYLLSSLLLNRYQLDDPLQATQTHLFCGLWGVIAFGLVHQEKGLLTTGQGRFLAIQLVGAGVIWLFSLLLTYTFFRLVTRRFHLRLSKIEEVLGLDCQEDEIRMQTHLTTYLNEQSRESMAKLTLLQLIKTGNHVSKKKKNRRTIEEQHYQQVSSAGGDFGDSYSFSNSSTSNLRRQQNIWKQRTNTTMSAAANSITADSNSAAIW